MANEAAAAIQDTLVPFVESNADAPEVALRAQIDQQGYLFFRGLVPKEDVLAVRRAVLMCCAEAGWLDPAYDPIEAIVAPGVQPTSEGKPDYMAVYRKVLKLPLFFDFPTLEPMQRIAHMLLGEQVLIHPRRIGRMTFPNNTAATTPPHQDYFYIRGSVETYSCWVPLGDCPIALGGLAVLPGTHKGGFLDHNQWSPGAVGGSGVAVEPNVVWHTTDFQAGDVLFFHSYTIHKALPNLSGNQLRISTDNRYQRPGDRIDPGALKPHFGLQ